MLLASSRNKINPASYNFKGIKGVKRFKERRVYSYYLDGINSMKEAEKIKKQVKAKGYKTAYIISMNR